MPDHPRYWLPLLAAWLLGAVLFQPAVRLVCWLILWGGHAACDYPEPPAYTMWAH